MLTVSQIIEAANAGESQAWEFKSAKGGVPKNLYETYSAMANTDGGVIVLGVVQPSPDHFEVEGVEKASSKVKEIWDCLNNSQKVSANLLTSADISVTPLDKKELIYIKVPRADRFQRPIFINGNPFTGVYRRNHEGDYKCKEPEVRRMIADASMEGHDARILEGFTLADLNDDSLRAYRQFCSNLKPDHPFSKLPDAEFCQKLGITRTDRVAKVSGLTVGGILMFGNAEDIQDAGVCPNFQLDYREKTSSGSAPRWDDRVTIDGSWSGNIHDFYWIAIKRLTSDIKVPFRLEDLSRVDESAVHEALREALTNALIHADYFGLGGVIIRRNRDVIIMDNPGTLLLSYSQILAGGISECRNKVLQRLFQHMGRGEKAGSGYESMLQGWSSQHWRTPGLVEDSDPTRVYLVLPMVSFLPEAVLQALHSKFGLKFTELTEVEVQALAIAATEGGVTNTRLQQLCKEHPAEITKALQGLVGKGFLERGGQKSGSYYEIPGWRSILSGTNVSTSLPGQVDNSVDLTGDSTQSLRGSIGSDLSQTGDLSQAEIDRLSKVAYPFGFMNYARRIFMERAVLRVCSDRFLTAEQLSKVLARNPVSLRNGYLKPLVKTGQLEQLYPSIPNHPEQAYRTVPGTEVK